MYRDLLNKLEYPALYQQSDRQFWNDAHISSYLLDAHLEPEFEGASRKLHFIDQSVQWIRQILPPEKFPWLLDIGCGPGIYAEKLYKAGYHVTGIDFSERSIDYAKQSAEQNEFPISYIYQNYLELDMKTTFDCAVFIYCDYGALSAENRQQILHNIYRALVPGGRLLLDVFSMRKYEAFEERSTWNSFSHGGFWSANEHIAVERLKKYPDHVSLQQTLVIEEQKLTNYYIWDCYFTVERLKKEAGNAGFQIADIFGDVAGAPYTAACSTIVILLEK